MPHVLSAAWQDGSFNTEVIPSELESAAADENESRDLHLNGNGSQSVCGLYPRQPLVELLGVTRKFRLRIWQHKAKYFEDCHTAKYNIDRLLYFEKYQTSSRAFGREKQLKPWSRKKKLALIRSMKPNLEDLAKDWFLELGNAGPSTRTQTARPRSG